MKHHLSSTIVCPPCATQYVVLLGSSLSGAIASSESLAPGGEMGHPRRARGRWSGTGGSGALRCRPQPTRRTPEAHGRAWPSQGLGLARAQPLSKKNTAQKGNQFARGEERKKQSARRKRGTTGAGRAAWRATQRFSQRPCAGGSVGGTDVPSRSVPCANVRQAAHLSRQLRSRPPPPARTMEKLYPLSYAHRKTSETPRAHAHGDGTCTASTQRWAGRRRRVQPARLRRNAGRGRRWRQRARRPARLPPQRTAWEHGWLGATVSHAGLEP